MNLQQAESQADSLCDMGYNAYITIAIFGKTINEHVYAVNINGFISVNRHNNRHSNIVQLSLEDAFDEIVF